MKLATILFFFLSVLSPISKAQESTWPQQVVTDSGAIVTVYQPQVEEFTGNKMAAREIGRAHV